MFEFAFYICLLLAAFGVIAAVYAGIMIFYEKIIRKSGKSVLQIINEI